MITVNEKEETLVKKLIEEERDLHLKISNLWKFITESEDWKTLDDGEQNNLLNQHSAMIQYDQCLLERIDYHMELLTVPEEDLDYFECEEEDEKIL